jgi:uncharacterized membrane protein
VNFLSFIAESKVFDRANGMTSIDNAREAPLWDVLIYASEKKGYEAAMNKFYERKYKTK